jgi:lipoprotein-anchoring transpeptidase ErfK/SrfK
MASMTSSPAARGLAGVLAVSACAGTGAPPSPRPVAVAAPPAAVHEIATARGDRIAIFRRPGDSAPVTTLASPNAYGAARAFLVERAEGGWLHVLLPTRPNGSKGWVRAADVTIGGTAKRVEIKAFTFTVYDGDRAVRTGKAAMGTGGTPTPPGRYYFTELVRPRSPDGPYGPYAFGLSGHSTVLGRFAGGDGQLAVHGTNLPGKLGTRVSHGCVRVANDDITWMARNLPIGTPVLIEN